MNTKDLLLEAVDLLKEGNDVDAATRVETAHDADTANSFEAISDKLYSDLVLENEEVANKFKNLYSKHVTMETSTAEEKETVVVNNTTNEKGSSAIKWIVIGLIVIVILFLLGNLLSVDSLGL